MTESSSSKDNDWQALLPELGRNKKHQEKRKSLARLKAKVEARELTRKMKSKKQSATKSKSFVNGKTKIKRTPKTVINNMKTGKETLRKAKARELVKERKDAEREAKKAERKSRSVKQQGQRENKKKLVNAENNQEEQLKHPTEEAQRELTENVGDVRQHGNVNNNNTLHELYVAHDNSNNQSKKVSNQITKSETKNVSSKETVHKADLERALIDRVIRGQSHTDKKIISNISNKYSVRDNQNYNATTPLLENDQVVHSHLPFLNEYVAKKNAEIVSQDELLHNAHVYFSELSQQEQTLHKVAAQRLKELKRINRQGGDKDGFRYVVPRNVKEMTKQLLATRDNKLNTPQQLQRAANNISSNNGGDDIHRTSFMENEEALINGDELASSFRGDELSYGEPHVSSRHRKRRRQNTFSDFYQFQVSRQWTKNAENFLKKGRASKSLFESRKQHRSIRKL